MAPLHYAAKLDPFLSFDCAGLDQILPSGNLDCSKLRHVELGLEGELGLDCGFCFPGEIPFPPGLKLLTGGVKVTIYWDFSSLKQYCEDCVISYPLIFCKPDQ